MATTSDRSTRAKVMAPGGSRSRAVRRPARRCHRWDGPAWSGARRAWPPPTRRTRRTWPGARSRRTPCARSRTAARPEPPGRPGCSATRKNRRIVTARAIDVTSPSTAMLTAGAFWVAVTTNTARPRQGDQDQQESKTENASKRGDVEGPVAAACGDPAIHLVPGQEQRRRAAPDRQRPAIHSPALSLRRSISAAGYPGVGALAPACSRAARAVFESSIAIVIGPTPPGTGVIAAGLLRDGLEVHVAHQPVIGAVGAHVDHHRALAHHVGGHGARACRRRRPARRPRGRPRPGRACASGIG